MAIKMAIYGYEAVDRMGKDFKGSIDADSIEEVKMEIRKQGLILLKIKEQNLLTKDINIEIGGYPGPRDLALFCRQFVSMTKAGVTILEVLKMLCDQTENKKLKQAIKGVRVNVEKGETFADSMADFPKIFPPIMMNMVAAGEASGSLDVAMERVAVQMERNSKTQGLVKKAMIYPMVVAIVAVAVVITLLVLVIPSYSKMFEDLGTELPQITKVVMKISDFIQKTWYLLVPIVGMGIFAVVLFSRTKGGKYIVGKITLSLPGIKNLVVKSAASRMARTLSTLISSGVPLVEGVDIVSRVMDNIWFKDALQKAKTEIILGVPLSKPLEESGLFPPMVYHMLKIGEESGNIEDMLDKLADYYDEEIELAVQSLMAAMEPLIIIIMAAVVGVLIAAVLSPMVKMYSALDNI